jgi:predicted amidohydrolase
VVEEAGQVVAVVHLSVPVPVPVHGMVMVPASHGFDVVHLVTRGDCVTHRYRNKPNGFMSHSYGYRKALGARAYQERA